MNLALLLHDEIARQTRVWGTRGWCLPSYYDLPFEQRWRRTRIMWQWPAPMPRHTCDVTDALARPFDLSARFRWWRVAGGR